MPIHVKYFASLRDRLGRSEDELPARAGLTVADVWTQLWPERPLPSMILTAVNQRYRGLDHPVQDGDEIAFFPPVTGG